MSKEMSRKDGEQIAEILCRRANEISIFSSSYTKDANHFGSVELALSREITRLRRLADLVSPNEQEDEE